MIIQDIKAFMAETGTQFFYIQSMKYILKSDKSNHIFGPTIPTHAGNHTKTLACKRLDSVHSHWLKDESVLLLKDGGYYCTV